MAGLFDDLLPESKRKPPATRPGLFDDLLPPTTSGATAPQVVVANESPLEKRVRERATKRKENWKENYDATKGDAEVALRQIAKGGTFNFSDRIEAGARALAGADYDSTLADIRAQNAAFEKANPGTAFLLQAGGGAAIPGPGMLATARAAGRAAQAAGAGQKTASTAGLAATGAVGGGLAGVGQSKDFTDVGDVAQNALSTAAVGAVAAPVIGGGVALAQKVAPTVQRIAQDVGGVMGDPRQWAVRQGADAFERSAGAPSSGQTFEQIRRGANDLTAALHDASIPGVTTRLAQANSRTAQRAGEAMRRGSADIGGVQRFVDDVANTQGERMSARVPEMLMPGVGQHADNMAALSRDAGINMDPAYAAIRNQPANVRVNVPGMGGIVTDNPAMARTLDAALENAVARGSISAADAVAMRATPDDLHPSVLLALRQELTGGSAGGDVGSATVRALGDRFDGLLSQSAQGRAIRDVARQHRTAFVAKEGAEAGEKGAISTGVELDRAMRNFREPPGLERTGTVAMHDTYQDNFKRGYAGGTGVQIASDPGSFSLAGSTAQTAGKRATIDELFPGRRADVENYTQREGNARQTATDLLTAANGGSLPKENALTAGSRAYITATFTPSAGIARGIQYAAKGMETDRRASELVRLLTSGSADDQARVMAELAHRDARYTPDAARRREMVRALISSGLIQGTN